MITAIEQALLRCNPDKFANICRLYLAYRYPIVNPTGIVVGKEKSKKGTPDNFVPDNDKYVFSEITTTDKITLVPKLKKDIEHCFNQKDIPSDKISRIILICNQEITTKIQEELNVHKNSINNFTQLEVIGLNAFANYIFKDYPSLARELGLSIDTGQILEMSDFVRQYEKSKFATPLSNAFYNRITELESSKEQLNNSDFLLITGQAGVGKTRFSLELVTNYIKDNPDYIVKYIRNNNQLIWEDLKIQLTKDRKYLIVVDDANKLKSNLISIINFKNEFKDSDIKIILTVRNYLKREVESELRNYELLELKNFDRNDLAKILQSPEYKISSYYVDRIFSISRGNPRIALMAAIAGLNNDIEKLNKASLILEEYFSSANSSIKDDLVLLKTAGILTLFRSIDISNSDLTDAIFNYFGIAKNDLVEKLSLLVKNELADEFKNTYKIADQILGEYIFYLIFIKEQHIPFSQLLDLHFDERKISLIHLLNPIISNYGFYEVKDLILYDLNQKWNSLREDQNKAITFLENFWFYLETETILYVNSCLKSLNQVGFDKLKFEIYKDNHIETYDDRIINLLVNFQNLPDKFEIALDLLMKYGLSSELLFTKVLKVFKQSFTYKRFSYEYGYKTQLKLFDFLYSKINENKIFYSKIIVFIADKYLIDSYDCFHSGDGNKFYTNHEYIALTEEHKKFREKLFNFIFNCYENESLKEDVYEFFERHHYTRYHEKEKRILSFDKKLIVSFFEENFVNNDFRESSIIHTYLRTLSFSKINYKKEIRDLISSKEFKLCLLLDERGETNKKSVINSFSGYKFEDYLDFAKSLDVIYNHQKKHFSITGIVSDIIENLAKKDFNLFLRVIEVIFSYEYYNSLYWRKILSSIDYNEEKISSLKLLFKNKPKTEIYLLDLFIKSPKEYLTIEDYNFVLDFIKKNDFTNIWFIDDLINKMNVLDLVIDDEIRKILNILISKIQSDNDLMMYDSFFKIINEKHQYVFIDNLKTIETLYLYFDKQRRHFDYDLEVLKIILSYNPDFIVELLKYSFDEKDYLSRRDFNDNDFKKLWDLDNYEVVLGKMMDYLVKFKSIYLHGESEFSKAFKGNSQKEIDFLNNKLVATNDNKMIELIFNIVTTVYRDKMLDFLKVILEKGCDLELFRRLDFYTSAGVTMGSRLPNMQFELSQYEKVKDFLVTQNNLNYYEFIEIIDRSIMYTKMSIERERKSEFVSEWD
ncbi:MULTISPECIES: hypothetical protein [Flavobacterium]|uniref:Novel STAND NTPase 3 domain-containing protein n=1 Tax=Flavobacterium hankyongi TaxID=1176532 RepID=A0ABP8ZRA7_9FLAO|nr:hypothetical protein [Flavobacterium sp. N1846]